MSIPKTIVFVLFFLLLSALFEASAEEGIVLKWSYTADGTIYSLNQDDINLDSYGEVLLASSDKLYLLDRNGNLMKTYDLNSKGKPYALKTGELTGDNSTKEIVLGFGWTERIPVDRNYLNSTIEGGVSTSAGILYSKSLNKGEIEIFDMSKKINEMNISGWVRALSAEDVDFDESIELVITTGGFDTYYYEEWTEEAGIISKCSDFNYSAREPLGYDCTQVYIEGMYCYRDCVELENVTYTITIHATTTTIEESENESGRIKEFFEDAVPKSSILVLSKNLTTKANSSYDAVFLDADVGNLRGGGNMNIVTGSSDKKLHVFSPFNITKEWEYESPGEIRKVWVGDLQDDGTFEIIIYFSAKVSGIQGITKDGSKFLDVRAPLGEELRTIAIGKLDQDIEKEIFLSTDRNLYAFDLNGKVKLKYPIAGINKLVVDDLDKNNFTELLISKDDTLYCYEFSGALSKKKTADTLCETAGETALFNSTLAKSYVEDALEIYKEINDTAKFEECSALLSDINSDIRDKRKTEADTFYATAITRFAFKDYKTAEESARNALRIYLEINYSAGITNSNTLLSKIREKTQTTTTVQTTTEQVTTTMAMETTTTTQQTTDNKLPAKYLAIGAAAVIVLISALSLIWKRKERAEEKELEDLSKSISPSSDSEEEQ